MPPKDIPAPDILPQSAARHARAIIRASRSATLATVHENRPYASFVTVAFDMDGSPLLLLSELAEHTRNIAQDDHISLLFEDASRLPNLQAEPRVTVQGKIKLTQDPFHAARFCARHPSSKHYAQFKDFNFYRVEMEQFHYVGGFAAALWLSRTEFEVDADAAAAMAVCEASVIAHMNADHADAIRLYANKLLAKRGKAWKMVGIDPDGFDLKLKNTYTRFDFETPVRDADTCRAALVTLVQKARQKI